MDIERLGYEEIVKELKSSKTEADSRIENFFNGFAVILGYSYAVALFGVFASLIIYLVINLVINI